MKITNNFSGKKPIRKRLTTSDKIKKGIKKILGKKIVSNARPWWHGAKAFSAAVKRGFPANKLILIGVNGTKGKTTTSLMIAQILNLLDQKAGYITGVEFFDGNQKSVNKDKLSTPDGTKIQKILSKMVKNGCKFAVIELTSQGLEQRRHLGLGKFGTVVFLNAYPEHLEAHGGWGNYILAKSLLFKRVEKNGFFVANYDRDQLATAQILFQSIPGKIRKTIKRRLILSSEYKSLPAPDKVHKDLEIENRIFPTKLYSDVEVANLYYAIETVRNYYPDLDTELSRITPKIDGAPGRLEIIVRMGIVDENSQNFKISNWKKKVSIMVDYAHEPESMKRLMETITYLRNNGIYEKFIHILSSDGDGRDIWKRSIHGDLSYKNCDYTILSTDNYSENDNPKLILDGLSENFPKNQEGIKFEKIIDRIEAFKRALLKAKEYSENGKKVLIFSTGVGTEPGLTQPGGVIQWNEKEVWIDFFCEVE